MEYTINQVAKISGISTRTLRYYDEIDLLKPAFINSSGYRIYGQTEIDYLQQILFYKRLGFDLENIKKILSEDSFSNVKALQEHQRKLLQEREQIDLLLTTVEKTLKYYEGEQDMTNEERFSAFKKQQIEKNDAQYGEEIRAKYGEETIKNANEKYTSLTEEDFEAMQIIEQELFSEIKKLIQLDDVNNETGKRVYELHKKWLSYSWADYSPEAHLGLAEMYLADERFAKYYNDAVDAQATKVLCEAIKYYA